MNIEPGPGDDRDRYDANEQKRLRTAILTGAIVTPDQSPPCGSVIQFQVQLGGNVYDYASIRAGDGKWYTTGDKALQGVDWRTLIDVVKHKLAGPIQVLAPIQQVLL